ncbi:hypothetical protein KG007_04105 [Alistipes sp. kh20]|jgi:hypothetical protein|uniref:cell division protein FtsQ/DivIB n=1 Tax=Alistipes TaxID=239759 RepID=UPI00189AB5C0|nr:MULTISPECIES: hypothetical protein [Alistipes]MBS4765391.1 hypothetical protein [Alistipes montrealensis]
MSRYLRYSLLTLVWVAVAAYIVFAGSAARRVRLSKKVGSMEIEVVDSSSQGHLVSAAMVRAWISHSGIKTLGTAVDAVDLTAIEQLIARNGFVDKTAAYVSYEGTLHITISQRKPLLRLLTDGMNAYVTSDGYVFAAPRASSLYVPVVTGSYRPPFPASYVGSVRGHIDHRLREIDDRIAELERDKYPLYRRELENDRNISALRRMRLKRQWWRLEGSQEFDARVDALREKKAELRRSYRYRSIVIRQQIEHIAAQQEAERRKQKKLEKSYEDFMKLLTFVETVEDDDFWRSEVVQITAQTTPSGALEVELTPRSGRYTILFGRLDDVERKFDKLLRFYRSGLSSIGWSEYRTIDIRYNDQVVCKK